MKSLVWRSRANVVAIIDLVMVSIAGIVALIVASFCGYALCWHYYDSDALGLLKFLREKASYNDLPVGLAWAILLWMLTVVPLVLSIQIWADRKLLAAVKLDDPGTALRNTRIWRRVSLAFLIISMCTSLVPFIVDFLFGLLWRLPSLFVVSRFITELETMPASAPAKEKKKPTC